MFWLLALLLALSARASRASDTREIDIGSFVIEVPTTWVPSQDLARLARQAETSAAELARAFATTSTADLSPLRIYDAPGGRVHLIVAVVNLPRQADRVLTATLAKTPKFSGEPPASLAGPSATTIDNQRGLTLVADSSAGDRVTLLLFGLPEKKEQLGAVAFWVRAGAEDDLAAERAAITASIHFPGVEAARSSENPTAAAWRLEIKEVLWGDGAADTVLAVLQRAALLIVLFCLNFFVSLQLAYAALRRLARARNPEQEGEPSDDELPIRKEYFIFPCALLSVTSTAWIVFLLVG